MHLFNSWTVYALNLLVQSTGKLLLTFLYQFIIYLSLTATFRKWSNQNIHCPWDTIFLPWRTFELFGLEIQTTYVISILGCFCAKESLHLQNFCYPSIKKKKSVYVGDVLQSKTTKLCLFPNRRDFKVYCLWNALIFLPQQ